MEVLGAILGAACNCLSPHASNCWKHHKNIKKNWEVLKDEFEQLEARKKDIKSEVIPGVTEERHEVHKWLERVEKIKHEIDCFEKKVDGVKFCARARRGKEVVEMIEKVKKLYQEGAFSDGALVRKLPKRGSELPTTTILEDETTSHKMREKILASLLDEKVSKIGVFGMGGIGKTTALEHINNELLLNPKFDKVIFVTVSKAPDVKSLQDKIASSLKLELVKDSDERSRAAELLGQLKESKKFVLILDDMWEGFALKDVGIPEPTSENGCKLVLTTRSRDICSMMSCEPIIQMENLSKDEALNLFRNSVGKRVLSNPKLEQMVKQVAQECACLPLAIVTVAGFLRDKDDPNYWVIALEDLKKATPSMSTDITEILRLSYDRLKDKKHQECLLYCALYPEDYPIEKDLLIDQLIAVGIVDEIITMHPMERGQVMLNDLVSVSLLIDTVDDDNAKCVKLHDSIRDMALQIMRENPTQFMAKAGESVESIGAEVIWNEGVEMVSLMQSKKFRISSSIEPPNCPMLSSLFLNQNSYLKSIPRNFFQQMQGLNVLDLSNTKIVELPESVTFLLNLTVLLLRWCRNLKHVPDLSKLSNMRRLDLCGTRIVEVPKGMENMVKLTYLDLSWTKLTSLPTGILCNLTNLQYLSTMTEDLVITEDLANHRNLKTLKCRFAELKHLNACVRSLEEGSLTNFMLTTKEERERLMNEIQITIEQFEFSKSVNIVKLNDCDTTVSSKSADFPLSLPKNVENLQMYRCRINVQSLCELTSINNITNLQQLCIEYCGDLMYLFYDSQAIFPILQRIERLVLTRLPSLRDFVGIEGEGVQPSLPNGSFSSLKYLRIWDCGNLKKLFSLKNASFPNLEEIEINDCFKLEEIVSTSRENEIEEGGAAHHTTTVDVITLPKLKKLKIYQCRNIKKLFSLKNPSFPNLEEIEIEDCSELEEIVSTSRENEIEEGGAAHHTTTVDVVTLPKLRELTIWGCGNLKKLFSLKNASFPNLEEIDIRNCSELEEIVSTSRENEIEEGGAAHHTTTVDVVTLPKLRELWLENIPKLQSIPFVADSLERLRIRKCPNLKRIPFLDREPWHPSLKEVEIDEESWSSLEWNYLKDKDAYWRELNKKKRR